MASEAHGYGVEEGGRPEVAVLFLGVSLLLGLASRQLLKGTRVPYTVALLLLGIGLGSLEYGTSNGLGVLGLSIRQWANINPNLILFVFLPALLFESSFGMDVHQIKKCLIQMVLLAGPGVVISTCCLGLVNMFLFPYGWNWATSFLLGGLLSATDPVAVVALLKELGTSKKLNTIIEGESLINDGVAIVVFRLFLSMVMGQQFSSTQTLAFLSQVAFGAVALGLLVGALSVLWVGTLFSDTVLEITLTITASYMAFFIAEDQAGVSGVLTVMTVGIFFAAFGKTAFAGESQESIHHFWEMIAYVANTLIFILSGTVIAESILRTYDNIEGQDWIYLGILYLGVQLSRLLVVTILYPALRYYGYGLDWKEATVLIWSGLRGAVALSLALSVAKPADWDSLDNWVISKQTEARFIFFTGGVVFLTLIINGSTAQYLIKVLKLTRPSEAKTRILEFVENEIYSKAVSAFAELGEDEELGPGDWTVVRKYLSSIRASTEDSKHLHPHDSLSSQTHLQDLLLQDTRIRFLNGLQAAYWGMLEEGRVTQTAAIILMESVNVAVDEVTHTSTPINDWKGLASYVRFPRHYKYVQRRNTHLAFLPAKLTSLLLVERLELACYISAAFLRGHRLARQQLHQFIGGSSYAVRVLNESEEEGAAAQTFLEDVRITFPQVLRVIKDKQISRATLQHLHGYIRHLQHCGLLELRETTQLHETIQMNLKKLLRDPPTVNIPAPGEVLRIQPLIGALPANIQKPLIESAREYMRVRRSILFEEGSNPDGIWLIANGVVKWSKEDVVDYVVHPSFSHGATLGLYEVLTGRNRICRVKTDTAVHCFFIERQILLHAIGSDPEIELFFWLESGVSLAKIYLPQVFEEHTIQELRALISASGRLVDYIDREMITLNQGEIGILLEGYLKRDGVDSSIITAPTGLTSVSSEEATGSEEAGRRNTYFYSESRSRVLIFHTSLAASRNGSVTSVSGGSEETVPRRRSSRHLARAMELGLFGSQEKGLEGSHSSVDVTESYIRPRSSSSLVRKMVRLNSGHLLQSGGLSRPLATQAYLSNANIHSISDLLRPLIPNSESRESDDDEEIVVRIDSHHNLFGP